MHGLDALIIKTWLGRCTILYLYSDCRGYYSHLGVTKRSSGAVGVCDPGAFVHWAASPTAL